MIWVNPDPFWQFGHWTPFARNYFKMNRQLILAPKCENILALGIYLIGKREALKMLETEHIRALCLSYFT